MERTENAAIWDRSNIRRRRLLWRRHSLNGPGVVCGAYCAFDGRYWVRGCVCCDCYSVFPFQMARDTVERICLKGVRSRQICYIDVQLLASKSHVWVERNDSTIYHLRCRL